MKSKYIVALTFLGLLILVVLIMAEPLRERGRSIVITKDGLEFELDKENSQNPFERYSGELLTFKDSLKDEEFELFMNTNLVQGHSFPYNFVKGALYPKLVEHGLIYVVKYDKEKTYFHIDGTRKGVLFQSMLLLK